MLHARVLRYLDEVARCHSMRKAGERLNVAGSAINRHILLLEEELGVKLFDRHAHRVDLTAPGELLLAHVRRTLADMELTIDQIETIKGIQHAKVAVAVSSGLAGTLMPQVVRRVQEELEGIKLSVRVASIADMISMLASGDIDLCLGFDLPTRGILQLARKPCALGAVVAPHHPLAKQSTASLRDCNGYPLIIAQHLLSIRRRLESAFEAAHLPLRPDIETDSIELMRSLVHDGRFVTFLSQPDILLERGDKSLIYVPVDHLSDEPETVYLVARGRSLSGAAERVGQLTKQMLMSAW